MNPAGAPTDPTLPDLADTVLVVPALNEAVCVADTIARWREWQPRQIRVVDNGSVDDTGSRAAEAGALVLHEPRRGYGAAAWRGIQGLPAGCRWVMFVSADGSDRLTAEELGEWRRQAESGADLIVGDRTRWARSRRQLKVVQTLGNRWCCRLIRLGWGRSFQDLGSLRWIRRSALEQLRLQDRGFGWNVEMQVRSIERGLRIRELPVHYHPRGGGRSKISGNLRGTFRAGWGILRMFWILHQTRLPGPEPATVRGSAALPTLPDRSPPG